MEVFFGLLAIGIIIVFVFILRSVFRINEIVENQKKQIEETKLLNSRLSKLFERLSVPSKPTENKKE